MAPEAAPSARKILPQCLAPRQCHDRSEVKKKVLEKVLRWRREGLLEAHSDSPLPTKRTIEIWNLSQMLWWFFYQNRRTCDFFRKTEKALEKARIYLRLLINHEMGFLSTSVRLKWSLMEACSCSEFAILLILTRHIAFLQSKVKLWKKDATILGEVKNASKENTSRFGWKIPNCNVLNYQTSLSKSTLKGVLQVKCSCLMVKRFVVNLMCV